MGQVDSPAVAPETPRSAPMRNGPGEAPEAPKTERRPRGFFLQYKPGQGKGTRAGTILGVGMLVAWGAVFVNRYLAPYAEEGSEWWRQLVSPGGPILFAVVFGALAWRITYASRKTGDFMIATESEMKKVNWSTKREVIGSTKVVIMFTFLMAAMLFMVDLIFQNLFSWLGVLKT